MSKPKIQVKTHLDFQRGGFPINRSYPPMIQGLENPSLKEKESEDFVSIEIVPIQIN